MGGARLAIGRGAWSLPAVARSAQLDLFGDPAVGGAQTDGRAEHGRGARDDRPARESLAARLPSHVRFGTSSWTFPGWRGLVYHGAYRDERDFLRRSLAEYARHPLFSTVGVDRSYYAPLPRETLRAYAADLPAGFCCVMKVWEGITSAFFADTPRAGARRGQANPDFLAAEAFDREVAAPLADAFAGHVGVLVLELSPATAALAPREVERRLERFFSTASRALPFAVELRDRRLFRERTLALLRAHDVAPCLSQWSHMPPFSVQLETVGAAPPGPVAVARLLLPPGTTYEGQKRACAPFDRIVRPDPTLRAAVVRFVREAGERGTPAFVVVNNKVEGSAPLTIEALAERVAADHEGRASGGAALPTAHRARPEGEEEER